MELILHTFDLKLKHKFKIAHDVREVQKTLIVELKSDSFSGFGEATANQYYGNTIESMVDLLEKNRALIESYDGESPEQFWDIIKPSLAVNSFAQCAVDVAVNDLYGKLLGKPLYKIWNVNNQNFPTSNYTIGIDTIDVMVNKYE